ncbi:MAG TPA: 2Fe-2S iron-sulfur cluster-binding protein [Phycisphaerae bacterium]|nr:2Fe-2S iron-sulfur cluster-binding protein [Phycisphaerae bacterium]
MPKIIIDDREIECREKVSVLQAALEAGWNIPHYCYHPGLSIVASCRLCLMEMKMPHPKTKEMAWSPKLFPSCQTPVKDGMEVRFASRAVIENQHRCMEYFLLNHPLDCPVCDQAGECWLQDYSREFGDPASRMVDQKYKNPKKDIGSKTLLYQDRCVLCTRCVRFCKEIAGTGELCVVDRGSREEIDVFPGMPLENALQGNVVDICPVGALLDKDFLMKQRVWELQSVPSICPRCSTGCAIWVDHNKGRVWRLRPRYNPGVNDWWMCDEGRFGWKHVHDPNRLDRLMVRRGPATEMPDWRDLPEIARVRLRQIVADDGPAKVAALLSPFMSCEEAWLLARFVREIAPEATLAMGPVPVVGEDDQYPKGAERPVKFTIHAEKCPNRRGVEMVLAGMGGATAASDEFVKKAGEGAYSAAWIVGGYPQDWVPKGLADALGKIELVVAQDMFPNAVTKAATIVIPCCAWVERPGCFVNCGGKVQPFSAALPPLEGCQRDGQYLFALSGGTGLYNAAIVREAMAKTMPEFGRLHVAPPMPEHAH